jgi:predicted AlkP superfamily pyrophosphatase or phosphodiesterase
MKPMPTKRFCAIKTKNNRLLQCSQYHNLCFRDNSIHSQNFITMNRFLCALLLFILSTGLMAQQREKPKVVVGIVVDQMRQEYLYRFAPKFGEGGFKRLINEGFQLKNAHYNYVPTYTGPGHASIYTGTTPAIHGIIGNDWFDKQTLKNINCVEDGKYKPVGNPEGNGDVAPTRLLTTTITDELKISTQQKAKVISLSIKDRGAVLPGGHLPDGAYWYDGKSGKFITSNYYRIGLPEWMDRFNALNLADQYLSREWKTTFPINQYTESGPDDSPYEGKLKGKDKPVFPYDLKTLRTTNGNFDLLSATPFGDDLLTEVAKAAIDGEAIGKDDITDFLAISYSCPDMVGHATGPNSIEIEDMYIRLDKNLEDLLKKLDKTVGAGQYTVFLTADHAVAENAQYLKDNSIPADYFKLPTVEAGLMELLQKQFPDKKIVNKIVNDQVFINQEAFGTDAKTAGLDMLVATEIISNYLLSTPGVAQVYSKGILRQSNFDEKGSKGMVVRGYNPKRSGDIAFVLEPGWMTWNGTTGSTHGSAYTYDTHVPIVFYGAGVKKGATSNFHTITDIAPTLSVLLKIKFPNGCTGQPISELLD